MASLNDIPKSIDIMTPTDVPSDVGKRIIPTSVMEGELQKRLYKALTECHPLYNKYFISWRKYLDAYRGGFGVQRYLIRHLRESNDNYENRLKRLAYLNYCKPIIQLYNDYIFRQNIVRECLVSELKEEYNTFIDNCDRNGSGIDEFMRQTGAYAKIFGYCWILCDMPNTNDEPIKNELQRKEKNIRPYLVNYIPMDVTNWETDEQGNLEWIRIREIQTQRRDIFITEKARGRITQEDVVNATALTTDGTGKPTIYRPQKSPFALGMKRTDFIYTTWTKNFWIRHKVSRAYSVEEVDRGFHNLGRVPAILVYHEQSLLEDIIGESFLTDIAEMNLLILNWLSLLDEEIAQKTLNILTMQTTADSPAEVVVGANNVLQYTGEKEPKFIAPATEPGEMIHKAILALRDEIYRQARLTGGMGVLKEMKSGLSFSYGFQETGQALADTADSLEQGETKVMEIWALWYDRKIWKGVIDYPDDFGIEDLPADMEVIGKSLETVKSQTFHAKIQEKIVDKLLPKINDELKKKIRDEIDKATQEIPLVAKGDDGKALPLAQQNQPPGKTNKPDATDKQPGQQKGKEAEPRNKTKIGQTNRGQKLRGSRKQHGREKQ